MDMRILWVETVLRLITAEISGKNDTKRQFLGRHRRSTGGDSRIDAETG